MIISHSYRYVYFSTPKTASTSISRVLVDHFDGQKVGNWHNIVVPDDCLRYFAFTSVRNPYRRLCSLYHHISKDPDHRAHQIKEMTFERYLEWLIDLDKEPFFEPSQEDFKDENSTGRMEKEFFHQCVSGYRGRDVTQLDYLSFAVAVNYLEGFGSIIRMEHLEEDFLRLPFVDKKVEFPKLNFRNYDWHGMISQQTETLMYQWSQEDFLTFGYQRGDFDEDSCTMASQPEWSTPHQGVSVPVEQ